MLGAIRAAAQSVSYEIGFRTLILCPLLYLGTLEVFEIRYYSFIYSLFCLEIMLMWFVRALAETNRTPFDFVEGESELVSGYMVEYGAFGFTLLVLAEYGRIMFISLICCCLFFRFGRIGGVLNDVIFVLVSVFIRYLFIVVRGTLPRYRYDMLIAICWKVILPLSVVLFILSIVLRV